jgi:CheY-like chemotaxis protein
MEPLLVLIDDDIREHRRLQALLPELDLRSYYTAQQALAGIRQLRSGPAPLGLIVLDYRLPDLDGAMLAPLLQELAPTTRVLPYSSLPEGGRLLGFTTAMPFLSKASPDAVIRTTLLGALGMPTEPQRPADPVVSRYLAGHAAQHVRALGQRTRVGLLCGARALLQSIIEALHTAGIAPALQASNEASMRSTMGRLSLGCLVADELAWEPATRLAGEHSLPLVLVALRPSVALVAVAQTAAVVLDLAHLGDAVEAAVAGRGYRDPGVDVLLRRLDLSPQELQLLPSILRDLRPAEAAAIWGMSEGAFRKARSRLFQRFDVTNVIGLQAAIDRLASDEPMSQT